MKRDENETSSSFHLVAMTAPESSVSMEASVGSSDEEIDVDDISDQCFPSSEF